MSQSVMRDALAAAEQALLEAESEFDAVERRRDHLAQAVEALRIVLLDGDASPGAGQPSLLPAPSLNGFAWDAATRADAVRHVFKEATRALGPGEIAATLRQHGKEADTHGVASTLMQMGRRGEIKRLGRGKWVWSKR